MIWIWIAHCIRFLGKLFLLPDAGKQTRIDPNSPCPACGNCGGVLKFVKMNFPEQGLVEAPMVQHFCATCQHSWCSEPVSIPKYPVDPR